MKRKIIISFTAISMFLGAFTLGVYASENWLSFTGGDELEHISDNTQEILGFLRTTEGKRVIAEQELNLVIDEKEVLVKEKENLLGELEELKIVNGVLSTNNSAHLKKIKENNVKISDLENDIKHLKDSEARYKKKEEKLNDEIAELNKTVTSLQVQLVEAEKDRDKYYTESNDKTKQINHLNKELEKANNKSTEAKKQSDEDLEEAKEIIGKMNDSEDQEEGEDE